MLKCVFVGRRGRFNQYVADWLSARTDLCHILWTDTNRNTWAWRWGWVRRALRTWGWIGTADRIVFRIYSHLSRETMAGWKRLHQDLLSRASPTSSAKDVAHTMVESLNAHGTKDLLRRLQPDIVFVQCVTQIIHDDILAIPRLGTFVYHEGLTPEYRGLHTIMWAIANGDDDKVGYTLLKANATVDGGDVYAQGATSLDPLSTPITYIGHWALFEGLNDVSQVLAALEEGTAQPIDTSARQNGYYSYLPYSGWRRILARRRERGLPAVIAEPRRRSHLATAGPRGASRL